MEKIQISRRGFFRLCMITAAGAAAAACGEALPEPGETPTLAVPTATDLPPTPTAIPPTPTEGIVAQITLDGKEFDAWTWKKTITGRITGLPEGGTVRVVAQGVEYDAKVEGERFSAEVLLGEGENTVSAYGQSPGGARASAEEITVIGRLRRVPVARIVPALEGGRLILDSAQSEPAGASGALVEWAWSPGPQNPAPVKVEAGGDEVDFTGEVSGPRIAVALPATDGEYYFTLRVKDLTGAADSSTTYVVVENGAPRIPDYDRENTAWVESAVVYGVIPRNFGSPAFEAITARLDYLAELGVTALWLAPVNVSPPGDYGYGVVDYFNLNPKYGTQDDFKRMVQEAHARGIRVLMDLVPNHSSAKHPYFLDAQAHGPDSPYWNFYDRDEAGNPTHYFNWAHLPNLNYSNPEVERMILEASSYWVREFGVDGYRVDACWGVKERRPEFWPAWRRELKRIKPEVLLLAEASARDPYYVSNGFDAAYDWTHELGHWAWEQVWESHQNKLLVVYLDTALTNNRNGYDPDALIFRFLNNNDTGTRFIQTHGEGMTRVSTAMLLTLPGLPCVYTADEVGEWFRPYFDPNPLTWDEKYPGLREYHTRLMHLRRETPALHSRHWQPVEVEPHLRVYGYLRYTGDREQPVLVLLNFTGEPADVDITLPDEFQSLGETGLLMDLLSGQEAYSLAPDALRIAVAGFTARILVKP
jgi:glycosidase